MEYANFCVCTLLKDGNDYDDSGKHIEHIGMELSFWQECVEKAQNFFTICLLPEILGNRYTRLTFKKHFNSLSDDATPGASGIGNHSAEGSDSVPGDTPLLSKPSVIAMAQDMIACDNHECVIEWLHITCLQMERLPKGKAKWYCPDCSIITVSSFLEERC